MKANNTLEYILKNLIDEGEDIYITEKVDDMGILLTVEVPASQTGRVIGSRGATADAIRVIIRAIGMTERKRVSLSIIDPKRK